MRSRSPRLILVLAIASACAAQGQERARVVVVDSSAKELKRTARRLRISVPRLKSARTALSEGTELAARIDPVPAVAPSYSMLGQAWVDLHRSAAPSRLGELARALRNRAVDTKDASLYQALTSAAQSLASALSRIDPDAAAELTRNWPAPPRAEGQPAAPSQRAAPLRPDAPVAAFVDRDPNRALAMLDALGGPQAATYSVRGRLAASLDAQGRRDAALRLMDGVATDFAARTPDAAALREYGGFVAATAAVDPTRALAAFGSLQRLGNATPGAGTTIGAAERAVALTAGEAVQWEVVRQLMQQPEMCVRTLEAAPELKAKVERAGGLDRVLSSGFGMRGPTTPVGASTGTAARAPSGGSIAALVAGLRGKATQNPAYVRQVLAEKAHDIREVTVLAQSLSWPDPDLASLLVERAVALLPGVEPLERRADSLRTLLQASRQVDGEADPALFRQGFILADDLREAASRPREGEAAPGANPALLRQADALEAKLVAEYAKVDFAAALEFARKLPDAQRFTTLIQIAQDLRMPF